MLANLKGPKFLKEFDNLIKAIGECKSKTEEDRIITAELELLKTRLNDPKLDKSRGREYMVRLIYCEMLGHDASWAYIKALQFASEPNIFTKKAAYLALTQFLDHNSELVLLLVNTLLSDLKSDNFIIVCTALTVASKLIGSELVNALYPVVVEKLKHSKEHVRKKAVMVLHRFQQLDPNREGPLAGVDIDRHFRTMLCDKDPSVMTAALAALYEVIKVDPKPYKNLIPSFTSILKQVSEHRLPKSYDYHRFPAPFIQIKILKILAALGAGDKTASENMYAVVHQTLRRANSSHTIGNALIYECVRTITTIYPNPSLLATAAEAIATFLKATSHNLRYVGVDALAGIVKINPKYAQEHQLAVIDCLEDPDDTLKLKTLELLYKMTKSNNVEVIVEKMMNYLRTATDEHIKRDIARKVSELAERYAPDPSWFIGVVSEVFELGGEHVEPQLAHNLMRLVAEQEDDLHKSAVDIYLDYLDKPKLPEILLQVVCWVLGEYGSLASAVDGRNLSTEQVVDKLCRIINLQKATDNIKGYIVSAILKLCAQTGCSLTPEAEDLVHKCTTSQSVDLQQRAFELQAILSSNRQLQTTVLPFDATCEEFDETELITVKSLSFLDGYVAEALRHGAQAYVPEEQRSLSKGGANGAEKGHLRFEAYETATAPTIMPASDMFDMMGSSAVASSSSRVSGSGGTGSSAQALDLMGLQLHDAPAPRPSGMTSLPTVIATSGNLPQSIPQPQLTLRNTASRKWGPTQFAPEPTPPVAPAPTPAASQSTSTSYTPAAVSSSQPSHAAAPPAPAPVTERDRLAASIFGGGGGTTTGMAASKYRSKPGVAPVKTTAPGSGPTINLLSPTAPAPAAPKTDIDLLLDLDPVPAAPVPNAAPYMAQSADPFGHMDTLVPAHPPANQSFMPAQQQPPQQPPQQQPQMMGNLLGESPLPSPTGMMGQPNMMGGPMGQPGMGMGPPQGMMGQPGMSMGMGPPQGMMGQPGMGMGPPGNMMHQGQPPRMMMGPPGGMPYGMYPGQAPMGMGGPMGMGPMGGGMMQPQGMSNQGPGMGMGMGMPNQGQMGMGMGMMGGMGGMPPQQMHQQMPPQQQHQQQQQQHPPPKPTTTAVDPFKDLLF